MNDAQTPDRLIPAFGKAKPAWLEVAYVDERENAGTAWIVVTLSCNGRTFSGMSPAVSKKTRRHGVHRAALATLNAVELFSSHQLVCNLMDIACVTTHNGSPVVIVRLRVESDGELHELFGLAPVETDFAEASSNAVLDATNVFVHSLLAEI